MRVFARVANLDSGCFVGAWRSSEHFVVLDSLGFVVAGNLRLEVVDLVVELEFVLVDELKADFVEQKSVLVEPVPAEQEFDFEISSSVDIADSVVFVLGIVAAVEKFDHEFVAEELQFVAAVDTVDASDLEIVDVRYFDLDLLGVELIREQLVLVHVVTGTKKCQ